MAEAPLRCNLQSCRKLLEDNALVTSCSHIFCQQHGQVCIKGAKCLACSTSFRNKYDYNTMDLQPSDQYKAMIITGMNPDQILEIAGRSITFYTYQLSNECRVKDAMLKQAKEENEKWKNFCNNLKTSFKADVDNIQRTANSLKKELLEKNAELEKYREQLTQYSRLNKKLQMELGASRRHIVTLKAQNSPSVMETTPSTASRFGLNPGSGRSERNDEFHLFQEESEESNTPFSPRWRTHVRYSE